MHFSVKKLGLFGERAVAKNIQDELSYQKVRMLSESVRIVSKGLWRQKEEAAPAIKTFKHKEIK